MEIVMGPETFVPFLFFGFLAAIILVPIWLRERTKQSAHKLISQALEKGQPLDPQIMRDLTQGGSAKPQPQSAPRRTLGSGVVLLALAAAFGGIAILHQDSRDWTVVPALIVGAVGAAFLLLAIIDYTTKKKDM